MKKVISQFSLLILLISILNPLNTYSAEKKKEPYSLNEKYELYKERVENICIEYKSNKIVANIDDNYPKIISKSEMDDLEGPVEGEIDKAEDKYDDQKDINDKYTDKLISCDGNSSCINNAYSKNQLDKKKLENIKKDLKKEEGKLKEINNKNTTVYSLNVFKKIHLNNMNNIYKCALLSTQKKSLLVIQNDLVKINPSIAKKVSGKIKDKVSKIKLSLNSINCIDSKDNNSVQKLTLLKQATYQTCKYASYLEYLKEYNKNVRDMITDETKEKYILTDFIKIEQENIYKIEEEQSRIYKIFPLAFHAYTEYENNITIHLLLELLKEDYISLREKLHEALNPINQVVYKISNAMRK